MDKPIYGISQKVASSANCPVQTLTPSQLTEYLNRSTGYLTGLLSDTTRNKQRPLDLLTVVRQELCVLTGKEFVGMAEASSSGMTLGPDGKYTQATTILPPQ